MGSSPARDATKLSRTTAFPKNAHSVAQSCRPLLSHDLSSQGEEFKLTTLFDALAASGFLCVLTDGLTFEAYLLQDGKLTEIDKANLERLSVEDAFIWFDAFLIFQKKRWCLPLGV